MATEIHTTCTVSKNENNKISCSNSLTGVTDI
jgi:hypothetical protein